MFTQRWYEAFWLNVSCRTLVLTTDQRTRCVASCDEKRLHRKYLHSQDCLKDFSNSVSFYTVPVADTLLFHRPPKIKINYNENKHNCFSTYHAFLNDLVACVVHCSACAMTDALSRWDDRAKHKQAFRIIKFCRIKDEVVADATFQQHTVSHWRRQTR